MEALDGLVLSADTPLTVTISGLTQFEDHAMGVRAMRGPERRSRE